ncbi:hypothetical protein KI688_007809 [Linnemannia hyalina]|uniref:Uncharacterized protein n=1 Tax=Linnemannia hyalina TaxID=64524 RepID=A0A9P7XIE0_9FUNG|nr:hypothetical protein KI688_007809 [Linnemannia hyalina]
MARKCSSIRRLSSASPKFHKYASLLTPKLHQLYRLTYEGLSDQDTATTAGGWSGADFFHGTGHCGCLGVQVSRKVDKDVDITVEDAVPIFVCKARNVRQKWVESFFVESENDILPCYLAIVSY